MNFMVAPCINDIKHFIVPLTNETKLRGHSPRANYNDSDEHIVKFLDY